MGVGILICSVTSAFCVSGLSRTVDLEVIGAKEYDVARCVAIAAEARGHMQACLQRPRSGPCRPVMHQLRELETRGWGWLGCEAASGGEMGAVMASVSAFLDSPTACQRVLRTVEETATGDHPRDCRLGS